jgi:hypothetical protein
MSFNMYKLLRSEKEWREVQITLQVPCIPSVLETMSNFQHRKSIWLAKKEVATFIEMGMVVHICNSSFLGVEIEKIMVWARS